ncbi:MAG: tRNA (guanosine(37)-N1)-methyltransferase TrmD [Nocardioides sp.]|uniref:tRNA (guanosine(37)-N1)-methyltransferase TrmD n=1 Tax=Nocardioides sp. TaxID=35761 RepID=UPI003F083CCE
MRIDVISIFPDYLAPLDLSLPGKARDKGLLDLRVHDLRDWARDRHRTVDDTPYGGGAGMVMKPEPWGEALDAVAVDAQARPTIVFTTPSGQPFNQALARELSTREHLVFACGRYEGIDQRVIDEAATLGEVVELSLGDYVLNGGEVAALAVTEAVVRLLPGFMGNPESLTEESHEDGLLEYPVYTKPAAWRGREVPPVLLSGDHGKVASWRHAQRVERTLTRRPDLATRIPVADATTLEVAQPDDAGEILTLQRACWVQEALANDTLEIHALHESLEQVQEWMGQWHTWVLRRSGRIVGAVRATLEDGRAPGDTWDIGRLMVAPDLQGHNLGRRLLEHAESQAPASVTRFLLFTGSGSVDNLRRYSRAGYREAGPAGEGALLLVKPRRKR